MHKICINIHIQYAQIYIGDFVQYDEKIKIFFKKCDLPIAIYF